MLAATVLLVMASLVQGDRDNIQSFRLPNNLVPTIYNLDIITHLGQKGKFEFEGREWIKVDCKQDTDRIVLHSKDLEIDESEVRVTSDKPHVVPIASHNYNEQYSFYIINLEQRLKKGSKYTIYIPYKGKLTQKLAGYYLSSYHDKMSGKKKWLSVTQFEATDARRAFPCFDEPAKKAQFKISLGHAQGLRSISNMPQIKTEPIKGMHGYVWDRFKLSKRMSTYLVAFMVTDFDYKVSEAIPGNNVTFRIWARPDAMEQTEYAGHFGPRVLYAFEKYFDIKYPLPKQDMVAIPDFSSGAMENWGLVTYREVYLLYDPQVSSYANKHSVASVVAHELAHQWFGNLVTMRWWTDLWLNEGFATYVAMLGVDKIHPEWNTLNMEVTDALNTVFKFDYLQSSHPVSVKIRSPSDIHQIFDPISYKKGASLLRMMALFLGEEVFREGVSKYLKAHKYSNAEQDDLWECLTEEAHRARALASDMTVKEIMDTWTLQTGYPLLTVNRHDDGTATITQQRFTFTGKKTSSSECWVVPITYTTQSEHRFENTKPKAWTRCPGGELRIKGLPGSDSWVIFNNRLSGLYKVQYDQNNWNLICRTLNSGRFTDIDVMNRVQLLQDSLSLAWTNNLQYDTAMGMMHYLRQETEYLPWRAALQEMNVINRLLVRTSGYGTFRKYMKILIQPYLEHVHKISDRPKTSDLQKMKLHDLMLTWACRLEMADCSDQSVRLYKQWMETSDPDNNNPIMTEMRSYVYCKAIKRGGEKEWDFAWQRYVSSNVGTEKTVLLNTMGCSHDPWILRRYLDTILEEHSKVRKQDSWAVFRSVATNPVGFPVAKDFFLTNAQTLYGYHSDRKDTLSRYLSVLADHMYEPSEVTEFQSFLANNKVLFKESVHAVQQAVENININVDWHEKNYNTFLKVCKEFVDHHKDSLTS